MSRPLSDKHPVLHIGITEFPPFVEQTKRGYRGFEIALWEAIAQQLDVEAEYKLLPLKQLIQKTRQGSIDVGFGGLSKTEERESIVDFTHTTYKSGLHILIPSKTKFHVFRSILNILKEHWQRLIGTLFALALFILAMGHVIWFLERGHNFSTDYVKGLGDSIWYVTVTISTVGYGDFTPVTLWGRVIGVFLIIAGYTIFALVIAQLNSIFVYEKLQSHIQEPADLRGKRVVTVKGTVSEELLEKYQPILLKTDRLSGAMDLLEANKADALVFDAPVLQHYLKLHGSKRFRITGAKFDEHDYGFILPEKSPWREQVNRAILRLIETGEYDALYRQWFGSA